MNIETPKSKYCVLDYSNEVIPETETGLVDVATHTAKINLEFSSFFLPSRICNLQGDIDLVVMWAFWVKLQHWVSYGVPLEILWKHLI